MLVCQPWVAEEDLAECDCGAGDVHPDVLTQMRIAASETLFLMTGRRYTGVCEDVDVRPCRVRTGFGWDRPWWSPSLPWLAGSVFACSCSTADVCGCGAADFIEISYPNPVINSVKVDGVTLAGTDYNLVGNRLYRLDGKGWPCCQDLGKADTEVGTWVINLDHGYEVPPSLRFAARTLTVELVKACAGKTCRITPVELDGVIGAGRTGLADVDLAIMAFNPHRHRWTPRAYAV